MKIKKIEKFIIENKILEKIVAIILFLYPYSVYFQGKLLKNILFPLLLIIAIYNVIKKGIKCSFYEKYFLSFIFIIIFSIIFQNYVGDKSLLEKIMPILRWGILPLIVGQLFLTENQIKVGIIGYFFSFIFILNKAFETTTKFLLDSTGIKVNYLEVLKLESYKNIEKFGNSFRLVGMFNTVTENAIMLGIMLIFSFCILINNKIKKIIRLAAIPFFLLSFYFMIISGSRGMYVALITTLLLSFLLRGILGNKIIKKIKLSIAVLVSIVVIIALVPENNVYKQRIQSIAKGDQARMVVYEESIKLFKENPLTGIGYGNFPQAEQSIKNSFSYWGKYKHEHNMGLKMLVETGILGFIIYFFMMGNIIYNLIKKQPKLINCIALGTISVFMIYENFETIIIYNKPNMYLFFLIALAINPLYNGIKIKKYFKENSFLIKR